MRCLAFRFQAFGRPVKNSKKFEEGIFSDLRNLKAGNDASLEEPKSAFLDFLYKNNCIRTQKKQKVFYWYSVPHDRLFLDALERDLKREKANQEATTMATYEPALSFEFDASQSLFEQLTKAQQGSVAPNNTSSYNGNQDAYSQSVSPALQAADAMPPPQMVSQTMQHVPQEALNDMTSYSQSTMPVTSAPVAGKNDQYGTPMPFDRHGMSVPASQRHSSVPAYMEYSPAPSFVSSQSHYEDYSNRGISYEPVTPPQQVAQYTPEPALTTGEDNGLYGAITDVQQNYQSLSGMPSGAYAGAQFNNLSKGFPTNAVNPMYSHIEGSPNYKQRRRRSPSAAPINNMPTTAATAGATGVASPGAPTSIPRYPHSVRRPSDLRRSVSASVDLTQFERSASGPPAAYSYMHYQNGTPNMSRQGSPLTTIEDRQPMSMMQQHHYGNTMGGNIHTANAHGNNNGNNHGNNDTSPHQDSASGGAGAFRRARSATTSEMGPYPQKSHSCPIPSCGRLFKRLEHLKR